MSWLQKYNNFLFAVFGTLLLGLIVFGWGSGFIASQMREEQREIQEMRSPERARELLEQNLSEQVISYGAPILIDSEKLQLTIVPVLQITLSEPETAPPLDFSSSAGSKTFSGASSYLTRSGYGWPRYGNFNNLLLSLGEETELEPLLSERGLIPGFYVIEETADPVLLYFVATEDTDKDGRLTGDDRLEMRLRSLTTQRSFTFDWDFIKVRDGVTVLPSKNTVVVVKNLDRDEDGEFDPLREPRSLLAIDVVTGEVRDYVDPEISRELQDLLIRG